MKVCFWVLLFVLWSQGLNSDITLAREMIDRGFKYRKSKREAVYCSLMYYLCSSNVFLSFAHSDASLEF